MSARHIDLATIQDRLHWLERRSGRLRLAVVVMTIVSGGIVLLAASGERSKVLDVEGLVLRDAAGTVRGKIETSAELGIVQTLLDSKGNDRVRLSVDAQGVARIRLLDDAGAIRISAFTLPADDASYPSTSALVVLGPGKDKKLKEAVEITTDKNGLVTQRFTDQEGNVRIYMAADVDKSAYLGLSPSGENKCALLMGTLADGTAYSQMFGADGKRALLMQAHSNGSTGQYFIGKDEQTRIKLAINPDEAAGANFIGKDGKTQVMLYTNPTGGSHQTFTDKDGRTRMQLNVFETGMVNQRVTDGNGKLRLLTYADAASDSRQLIFDKDEKLVETKAPEEPRVVLKPVPAESPSAPLTSSTPAYHPESVQPKPREEQCLACRGVGQVTCSICKGNGKVPCTKCDFRGLVECGKCDAEGMVSGYLYGKSLCTNCSGAKRKLCADCSGTKSAKCTGWFSGCGGDGKVACSKCFGSGRVKLNNGSR